METHTPTSGPKNNRAPLSLAAILILTVFSLGLMLTSGDYKISERVISWDVISYYNYLPAAFKYQNFDFAELPMRVGYVTAENGIVSQKMTMGVAFLYLPFYLIAWLYTSIAGLPYKEYSEPFSLLLNISAIFYFLAGMFFLRKTLLMFFSDLVTTLGLLTVFLGTNLLFYTAYYGPMSHVYSFFLISLFLWLLIRWHEKPTWGRTILFGLVAGWILLVRPSNVTVLLLVVFWNMHSRQAIREKFGMIRANILKILVLVFFAALIWVPQMIYWKYATGHLLYFSYQGESFFFSSPKIIWGLLSYRNGWLLYAPVMIFSLAGFFFLRKNLRVFLVPVVLFFMASIYIIFSWWCWWYVGFGLRAMIDLYPVLAIPLCAIIARILLKKKWLTLSVLLVWGFLLAIGMFKNYQFRKGIIHFDSMTSKAYWVSFFSMEVPNGNYYPLLKTPDYKAAEKGENKVLK